MLSEVNGNILDEIQTNKKTMQDSEGPSAI